MVHGRFINLPLKLIPHLHRNLLEDLEWIKSQKTSGESGITKKRSSGKDSSESNSSGLSTAEKESDKPSVEVVDAFFGIENILILAPCSGRENASSSNSTASSHDVTGDSSVMFDNFEDEIFFQVYLIYRKLKLGYIQMRTPNLCLKFVNILLSIFSKT